MDNKTLNTTILNKLYDIAENWIKTLNVQDLKGRAFTAFEITKLIFSTPGFNLRERFVEKAENQADLKRAAKTANSGVTLQDEKFIIRDAGIIDRVEVDGFGVEFDRAKVFSYIQQFESITRTAARRFTFGGGCVVPEGAKLAASFTLHADKKIISELGKHTTNDPLRPVMRNIYLNLSDLEFAASDCFKMLTAPARLENITIVEDLKGFCISPEVFKKMSGAYNVTVYTIEKGTFAVFEQGDQVADDTVTGIFPNYRAIIPARELRGEAIYNDIRIEKNDLKGLKAFLKANAGRYADSVYIVYNREKDPNGITFQYEDIDFNINREYRVSIAGATNFSRFCVCMKIALLMSLFPVWDGVLSLSKTIGKAFLFGSEKMNTILLMPSMRCDLERLHCDVMEAAPASNRAADPVVSEPASAPVVHLEPRRAPIAADAVRLPEVSAPYEVSELSPSQAAPAVASESTAPASPDKIEDFGEKIGGARKDKEITRREKAEGDEPAWMKKFSVLSVADVTNMGRLARAHYNVRRTGSGDYILAYTEETKFSRRPIVIATGFDTPEAAMEYRRQGEALRQLNVGRDAENKFIVYRRCSNGKNIYLAEGLESKEAAFLHIEQNAETLLNRRPTEVGLPHLENLHRIGPDYRGGRDVTPSEFMQTFNFRGVEFGNWLPDQERREVLNQSYDALRDLADVLGVDPTFISLEGNLSAAFGSRGVKSAAAHYEPTYMVFNLTRLNGAGSLAHEWFHAFDNFRAMKGAGSTFARMEGSAALVHPGTTYATQRTYGRSELSQQERDAFGRLSDSFGKILKAVPVDQNVYVQKFEKRKEAVSKTIEELRAELQRERINYRTKKPGRFDLPATAEQMEAFQSIADRMLNGTGEFEECTALVLEMSKLFKKVRNRSEVTKGGALEFFSFYLSDLRNRRATAAAMAKETDVLQTVETDYLKNAKKLDSMRAAAYYTNVIELGARAFAAYCEDRLTASGRRSDYLVRATTGHAFYMDHYGATPFPAGNERLITGAAFADLFQTVTGSTSRLAELPAPVIASLPEKAPEKAPEAPRTASEEVAETTAPEASHAYEVSEISQPFAEAEGTEAATVTAMQPESLTAVEPETFQPREPRKQIAANRPLTAPIEGNSESKSQTNSENNNTPDMEQINQLRAQISRWNHEYYNEARPTVTDMEFDAALQRLQELERAAGIQSPESPTALVGSDSAEGFAKARHLAMMLSLSNSYNESEISQFVTRTGADSFVIEPKYDGLSLELIYRRGALVQAITRGNGQEGDDVTANARTIADIPQQLDLTMLLDFDGIALPDTFAIRGEVMMSFGVFDALNEARKGEGLEPFANPRNAAAGALKLTDAEQCAARKLSFRAWGITGITYDDATVSDHEILFALGLPSYYLPAYGVSEISAAVRCIEKQRDAYPWPIDGAVIKCRYRADRERLGEGTKAPNWAVAFKYAAENVATKLTGVRFQVGRTGRITPVAEFAPVWLAGTRVVQASLHNADFIDALDLREGDFVCVEKGGEIIPKVTRVEKTRRTCMYAAPIAFPTHCPVCASPLLRETGGADTYCTNPMCANQVARTIEHYCKTIGMKGFGPSVVAALYNEGRVRSIGDLYRLKCDSLRWMDGFGASTSEKLFDQVRQSLTARPEVVLAAMGIRLVGLSVARLLVRAVGSLAALRDCLASGNGDRLTQIPGIGAAVIESLSLFFAGSGASLYNELAAAGLEAFSEKAPEAEAYATPDHEISHQATPAAALPLAGMSIVISGVFEQYGRDELRAMIEQHGGKCPGSVSARTSCLLAGSGVGPSKIARATELGVRVIGETELLAMLRG